MQRDRQMGVLVVLLADTSQKLVTNFGAVQVDVERRGGLELLTADSNEHGIFSMHM